MICTYKKFNKAGLLSLLFLVLYDTVISQNISRRGDYLHTGSEHYNISLNIKDGTIDFVFSNGSYLKNTAATVKIGNNVVESNALALHEATVQDVSDAIGKGKLITFSHQGAGNDIAITQYITIYEGKPFFLLGASAQKKGAAVESNYISPLAILSKTGGQCFVPGNQPRLMDMPYDNDNWTKTSYSKLGR